MTNRLPGRCPFCGKDIRYRGLWKGSMSTAAKRMDGSFNRCRIDEARLVIKPT